MKKNLKQNNMATKKEWQDYVKLLEAYLIAVRKWVKKHGDGEITAEDIGSNPPPPPPPPPGN